MRSELKFTLIAIVIQFGLFQTSLAKGIETLEPRALDCFQKVLQAENVFSFSRKFLSPTQLEELVVSLCTYSDAEGAIACYLQAHDQDGVFPKSKNFVNTLGLEKKYARLCSNSGANWKNLKTEDMDAIDCFKTATQDTNILGNAKKFLGATELEDLTVRLCISSNGKGVSTCYANAVGNPEIILKANNLHGNKAALDLTIVELCKASRL